jgi:hypothetical protein
MVDGMTTRLARWGAALLMAVPALLVGCGGGRPHPAASPSAAAGTQQVLAIGRRYAQCVREHGVPNFPDPIVDNGYLEMPAGGGDQAKRALSQNKAAQDACRPILNELPPSAKRSRAPLSAQDMQDLLRFAQCMRQHGIPQWPDPNPDGSFPLSAAGLASEGKSPRVVAGLQACRQYWDKGITPS